MKSMQNFHDWLFSRNGEANDSKRRLKGLIHFDVNRIISVASLDPWWVWGAEASPMEA
jgi:hypothetical protein